MAASVPTRARPLRVFRSFSSRVREAMRPHVLEMSRGMQIYSERAHEEGQLRLRDLDDLEKYCYYVAGTVGELLTDLFFEECPHCREPAARSASYSGSPLWFGATDGEYRQGRRH